MSHTTRRILFALNEPGYFRMYGSTIAELSRRGWSVSLVYDRPHRRGPDAEVPPTAGDSVQSLGSLPRCSSPGAATRRIAVDYLRYLEPDFANAQYLRRRVERKLPASLTWLTRVGRVPRWLVSAALAVMRGIERIQPVMPAMLDLIREVRPEVVVVSPLVIIGDSGVAQTELVRAARALRVPVIVGVASWDHLTSKGLIRVVPDAVTVWNETQAQEAVRLHRVPRSRIVITGAQSLDHWFEPTSATAVQTFRQSLGIPDDRDVILLVGSSANIAPGDSEVLFVRRWLAALRRSETAEARRAFVIVRPHPGNTGPWQDVELGDAAAVIFPRKYSGLPLSADEIAAFRHSMVASKAVVGINTTAMIEAAILRRPVFTIRDAAFEHSQAQTLHFSYLVGEQGFVSTASSLPEHIQQLDQLFARGGSTAAAERFVEQFVRPLGLHEPATTHLCDVIERIADRRRAPSAAAVGARSGWDTSRAKAERP